MSTVEQRRYEGERQRDEFGRKRHAGDDGSNKHNDSRQRFRESRRHGSDAWSHERDDQHSDYNRRGDMPAQYDGGSSNFMDAERLESGVVVRGRVMRIEPYGAFIDFVIGTNQYRGLAHISQLSEQHVGHVEDVVQMRQVVFAKVLEVQGEPGSQQQRIRLSLKEVDPVTGQAVGSNHHVAAAHGVSQRAFHRERMFRERARGCTWEHRPHHAPSKYEHLLWSRSPSPPPVKAAVAAASRTSESGSSGSEGSDSEDIRRRRSKRHRTSKRGRSSRDRQSSRDSRRRHRRRRSPSTSSESSSSSESESSDSSSSESSSTRSRENKRVRKQSADDAERPSLVGAAANDMDEDDLREAKEFRGAIQGNQESDDDEDEEGPMPLLQSDAAASGAGPKNPYGGALLPGEGQAIAQFVQQNLRIPRRGEIGYSGDDIDQYEKSGFVMSGSRHARMNAVRIRKENQVYSAEEQRALALITMEENQQKEAQLMQDFRTMLKEKQKQREQAKGNVADAS